MDWDIEYRPWAMGFDTIPTLRTYIERLHNHPDDYSAIIKGGQGLKASTPNKAQEFNFMITLFNRFYLNHHPNPKQEHIQKYIQPRYVSGAMHRNITDQITPTTEKNTIELHLTSHTRQPRTHRFK